MEHDDFIDRTRLDDDIRRTRTKAVNNVADVIIRKLMVCVDDKTMLILHMN